MPCSARNSQVRHAHGVASSSVGSIARRVPLSRRARPGVAGPASRLVGFEAGVVSARPLHCRLGLLLGKRGGSPGAPCALRPRPGGRRVKKLPKLCGRRGIGSFRFSMEVKLPISLSRWHDREVSHPTASPSPLRSDHDGAPLITGRCDLAWSWSCCLSRSSWASGFRARTSVRRPSTAPGYRSAGRGFPAGGGRTVWARPAAGARRVLASDSVDAAARWCAHAPRRAAADRPQGWSAGPRAGAVGQRERSRSDATACMCASRSVISSRTPGESRAARRVMTAKVS
jgi:hypothetical protein